MIVIVDYGLGNPSSIRNMLKKIGAKSVISSDPDIIMAASRLILPGVGAFDRAMMQISELALAPILRKKAIDEGTPILGVCLGMHLLTLGSEEGELPGLGLVEARCEKFRFDSLMSQRKLNVPHMGWNEIALQQEASLLDGLEKEALAYFAHSYFIRPTLPEIVLATTHYGFEFASIIGKKNIMGVQFHPEKSYQLGAGLLKNFANM